VLFCFSAADKRLLQAVVCCVGVRDGKPKNGEKDSAERQALKWLFLDRVG